MDASRDTGGLGIDLVGQTDLIDGRYRCRELAFRDGTSALAFAHDLASGLSVGLELWPLSAFPDEHAPDARSAGRDAAVCSLRHANVVRVYRSGICRNAGVHYREVEPGTELEAGQRLVSRRLSDVQASCPREAARMFLDAARGLEAAHAHGVFHLALHPEVLRIRPLTRRVQVTGLGLPPPGLTDGRTAYMAPEQATADWYAEGTTSDGLRRADVYGLAAVFHAHLCGAPPEPGTRAADIHAGPTGEPARFGRRWTRPGKPRLPASLACVLARALSVDPRLRHPSCEALAADLEAFLSSRPTSLDVRPGRRLALWATRHRSRARGLARLALLALAVGWNAESCADVQVQRRELGHAERQREAARALGGESIGRAGWNSR